MMHNTRFIHTLRRAGNLAALDQNIVAARGLRLQPKRAQRINDYEKKYKNTALK